MQSADLFSCSCNALLITRGEGCLIIAGGGIKACQPQTRQIHQLIVKTNKPQKIVLLLPCCKLNGLSFFVFLSFKKEGFSPP